MVIQALKVLENREIATGVWTIRFRSPEIASSATPGQFLNLKPDATFDPLLRRAYSIHRILDDDVIELIYNVHGKGSLIFSKKEPGDSIDVMGPLGVPFHLEEPFDLAILVSGGLGIAPMPFLGDRLAADGIEVMNVHGARSSELIAQDDRLINPRYATDDGSLGIRGTVVTALEQVIPEISEGKRVRLFACGPNVMLGALEDFCALHNLPLEVSLECQMACGVGICQGCPVAMRGEETRYTLVCTHGPNYDITEIELASLPTEHG